ncbi:MAG: hypothetical protein HUU35_18740 [Armatimonadetes bacterium]|nr:hypothetical protein [Armatimonadota bacterium]
MPAQPRAKRLNQNPDAIWIQSMLVLAAFMVIVVVWRWWMDRQPAEVRFGVRQVVVEPQGGQINVPLASAPELTTDGGVIALQSGPVEAFVVRVSAISYMVFSRTSANGRQARYDINRGIFVDRRDETFGFDRSTGNALNAGADDRLPRYINRATSEMLEIQMAMQ